MVETVPGAQAEACDHKWVADKVPHSACNVQWTAYGTLRPGRNVPQASDGTPQTVCGTLSVIGGTLRVVCGTLPVAYRTLCVVYCTLCVS